MTLRKQDCNLKQYKKMTSLNSTKINRWTENVTSNYNKYQVSFI